MPRIGPGVGLPPSLPGQQLGRAGSGQVTTDARGIERDGTGGQGHRAAPKQICGTQETARPQLLNAATIGKPVSTLSIQRPELSLITPPYCVCDPRRTTERGPPLRQKKPPNG